MEKSAKKLTVRTNNSVGSALGKKDGRANVKEISNGYIVSESFTDKSGKYVDKETYYKENPFKDAE
jgi:hypothetical protein